MDGERKINNGTEKDKISQKRKGKEKRDCFKCTFSVSIVSETVMSAGVSPSLVYVRAPDSNNGNANECLVV